MNLTPICLTKEKALVSKRLKPQGPGFIEATPNLSGFNLRPVSSMYVNNCRNGTHINLKRLF